MRAIFLADGNVFTTGFSRMSERQLALWNPVCPSSLSTGLPWSCLSFLSRSLGWYVDCRILSVVF